MRLKLFRAAHMSEAMRLVRDEMGADAIILSTRGWGDGVEVTAALDEPLPHARDASVERALVYHHVPEEVRARLLDGGLAQGLAALLHFAPIDLSDGAPPILFAGAPGAGKTLTVARVATRLMLAGRKPVVITADGRRAGAAEQLAAFTRLLGIDLIVASHPALLVKALSVRRDGAPVLVDLPGGCGFEGTHRDEMSDLAGCVGGRLALVLPAGLDPVEAAETAAAHLDIGGAYLVVTRTDVARRLGCVLAAAAGGMALSEAGIGPGAVDGLIPLTPDWLAGRLLGHPMGRGA